MQCNLSFGYTPLLSCIRTPAISLQAFYLPLFRILCKSQRGDFFTGWWLMNNGYAMCMPLYPIVIQFIIITTKHAKMKLKVTHWEKLTGLWLPDFPKCPPCFYILLSRGKSWKVSPFFIAYHFGHARACRGRLPCWLWFLPCSHWRRSSRKGWYPANSLVLLISQIHLSIALPSST